MSNSSGFQCVLGGFHPTFGDFLKGRLRCLAACQPLNVAHKVGQAAAGKSLVRGVERAAKLLSAKLLAAPVDERIIDTECFLASRIFASVQPVTLR